MLRNKIKLRSPGLGDLKTKIKIMNNANKTLKWDVRLVSKIKVTYFVIICSCNSFKKYLVELNPLKFYSSPKNIIKIQIIIVFICLQFGCNLENKYKKSLNNNYPELILTAERRNDNDTFFDLIDTFKVIKLETTNESLFGDISKLEILNDTVIIFDSKNQNVLTFDFDGRFLGNIGKKGKGPNEILNIRNIAIDRKNEKVLILDDIKQKVIHYTLDGRYTYADDAVVFPHDFAIQDNHLIFYQAYSSIFFNKNVNYDLLITKNDKIVEKYFPFSQTGSFRYPLNKVFYEVSDTLCFIDKWDSRIYSIVDKKLIPRFDIDFKGNDVPIEFTVEEKLFNSSVNKYSYLYGHVVENNTFIYFRYYQKGDLKRVLYNKNNHNYHTLSTDDDNSNIFSLSFAPTYSYKEYFVSVLSPILLIEADKRGLLDNSKIQINVSDFQISDNDILMLYKLK